MIKALSKPGIQGKLPQLNEGYLQKQSKQRNENTQLSLYVPKY